MSDEHDELAALTYALSHNLRAPLRTIEGFGEVLEDEYRDKLDEQALDYLGRIRSAAAHMDEMIRDIGQLAEIARAQLHRERVDISDLSASILATLRESEPKRNVAVSIEPALSVEGDPHLLRIAFEHLLGNAWKFTSRHDSARIEVAGDGDHVFFVRDNGAGFDPQYAQRLFAPFQRLHSSKDFGGNGIGLAIVRRIAALHGGDVSLTGQVNQGATATLRLSRS